MTATFLFAIAVVLAALGIWVLRARSSAINYWFAAYTFGLALWTFGLGILHSGFQPEFSARLVFAAASLLPCSFLAFAAIYPTESRWPPPLAIRVSTIVGASFSILSLSTPLLVHDAVLTPEGFTRKSGPLYPLFAFYFLATWLTALGVLTVKWWSSRGHARAQLQYLAIGLVLHGVGGISANLLLPLLLGNASYTWLGPFFTLPLVVLVGHAIIRHRLMDLRLILHRWIVHALIIGSTTICSVMAIRQLTPPENRPSTHWSAAFVTLIMLSAPVQRHIARVIDRYLYRGRLEYGSVLASATRRLTRLMQPSEVASELKAIVGPALVPEFFVMVLRPLSHSEPETLLSDNDAVVEVLRRSEHVSALIQRLPIPSLLVLNSPPADARHNVAHDELRQAGGELLMTLGRRGDVLGIVVLGPRRSGEAYFDTDLALLESLCELSSIALENALLYRQRLEIERNQRRIEHLAMMARFYTGIAHEIRSPLASISNFIAMLPDRFDDAEYRDIATRLLPAEVARITRLADRLRLMAPSESGKLDLVSLPSLLSDIIAIHSAAAETRGVNIIVDAADGLPRILGDQGQLVQLFVNLVNNALDAMPNGGTITIQAVQEAIDGPVTVRVIDSGVGIDPEIEPRVFEPFFTTKTSGTGLGLTICREIAEFHHASLSLRARGDAKGTIVTVQFPLPPASRNARVAPEHKLGSTLT